MDLKSILLYVAVILLSGGLAVFVFNQSERSTEAKNAEVIPAGVDDPIWYRHASLGARRAQLKKRLALMTSRAIAPEMTGPTKDEVALLCRDERLVDDVVDAFRSHPNMTPALLSAFMEIFARVKHPKFARLLEQGFKSREYDVRLNAADAGLVQGDARAVSEIGEALLTASGMQAQRLLHSLIACGGGEAMDYLEGVILQRSEPELILEAIHAMAKAGYTNAIPTIREKTRDSDKRIAVAASMALAMMGQQDGYQNLLHMVNDGNEDALVRSECVQFLYSVAGSRRRDVYEKLRNEPGTLGFEARLALLKLRDPEVLEETKRLLVDGNPHQKIESIGLLGASGNAEDVSFLMQHVDEMSAVMVASCLSSLKRGRARNAGDLLGALALCRTPQSAQVYNAIHEFDAGVLPGLEQALSRETDPTRRNLLLRAIANIPSIESLRIIESAQGEGLDFELLRRSLIRKVDLSLLKQGVPFQEEK